MAFCTSCGKQLNDGVKFCTGCGKALKQKSVAIPTSVQSSSSSPVQKAPVEVKQNIIKPVQRAPVEQPVPVVKSAPLAPRPVVIEQAPVKVQVVPEDDGGMKCKKCGSGNVSIQILHRGETTKRKGVGLGGNVNNLARGIVGLGTLGLSNLVWKKSEGVNQTQIKNIRMAICQNCGKSWQVSVWDNFFGI